MRALVRVWLTSLVVSATAGAATAPALAQWGGWVTTGNIKKPIPATDSNGKGVPGCLIAFGRPDWPNADLPCAVACDRPVSLKPDLALAFCRKEATTTFPSGEKPKIFAPPTTIDVGDKNNFGGKQPICTTMVGPPDYPNWTVKFPKGHPMCGGVTGEPHVTTFDKVRYDLQAAGEFVAVASPDDELQVQLRLEAVSGTQASVVTAAAARVGTHRVTVTAGTAAPLRLDGTPIALEDGMFRRLLDTGGAIVRTLDRYSIVWRDGTNLHVDVFSGHLNVFVLAAEPRDGRLVGLLGNAGGDGGANDFRTRDGRPLASPPAFIDRYTVFAESWRVRPEESLFDYGPGQSTATFARRDFPARELTLATLDAPVRARAEARCRAAGVRDPAALDACVLDVAITGSDEFVASALSLEPPPELRADAPAAAETGAATSSATFAGITVTAPREVIASFPVEVTISGPTAPRDMVVMARDGSPDREQVAQTAVGEGPGPRTLRLVAHNELGLYEFRYKTAESGFREAVIRLPYVARDPVARLEVLETAAAGGEVRVRCVGECSPLAYVNLVPAGSPDSLLGAHAYLARGPEVTIRNLPKTPGE